MKHLYFDELKEPRDDYFVEYLPAGGDTRFATLQLIFTEDCSREEAKTLIEKEAQEWLKRYPVPVMVTAFDTDGDIIRMSSSTENDHLIAWYGQDNRLENHWKLLKDSEIPSDALSIEYLLSVYNDIKYKTDKEVKENAYANVRERAKGRRILIGLIFLWAVVVPATVALLGWANPIIGGLVTLYALGKAAREGAILLGWTDRTDSEKEKAEKERLMLHYYYHCEKNPDGYRRLMVENLTEDGRDRIQEEAEESTKPSKATR